MVVATLAVAMHSAPLCSSVRGRKRAVPVVHRHRYRSSGCESGELLAVVADNIGTARSISSAPVHRTLCNEGATLGRGGLHGHTHLVALKAISIVVEHMDH